MASNPRFPRTATHIALCLAALLVPSDLPSQTTSGVPPGGNQYEMFTTGDSPSIRWRGWNAARTRVEFFITPGQKPNPVYRRYPMRLSFSVDTLNVTFDTREMGDAFFDPFIVPYEFAKPGNYLATVTEWYLAPDKKWEKVVGAEVIVPVRSLP